MNRGKRIGMLLLVLAAAACSTTRGLRDNEFLLRKNTVKVDDKAFNASGLNAYLVQKPNSYILGMNPLLSVYNWSGDENDGLARLYRSIGTAPVVYDSDKVQESVSRLENHLRYIGYYGSRVESEVQVKGRKVYVTYYVFLGKRYEVSAVDYEIPSYGTLRQDFEADLPHSTITPGTYLSEMALETEADRSAQYFRNQGYYGLTKSYYAFEADTLAGDGKARLKYAIRDYALGDDPSSAQEHRKFTIGAVNISYPDQIKIRPSVLENLNLLHPGQPYSERDVNYTYSRFTNVSMLSGVNVNVTPSSADKVDCNIILRNSGIQGFKTNLEASVNSTGLIGVSPQVSYFHKNLFHGGEILNMAVKGNFQFKPNDDAKSTDVSFTSSIRFPKFIGLPNRLFKGPYIPRTDVSVAYNYQNRPEYRRSVFSSALTYNGRLSERWFYQFSPARANISRLYDISADFLMLILSNLYLIQLYQDNFDLGVSGMLYYTTDSSPIPTRPYHYARLSVDMAGNFLSLFNPLMPCDDDGQHVIWNVPYNQYVRGELQLGKTFRFGRKDRQSLALHFVAGAGYGYGNSITPPIDKQFYCGGSSSMRGWQARTLGPGSDTSLSTVFIIPAQLGEMKLEANMEYRFPLLWKLEGAAFVDAGNIWDVADPSDEAAFSFDTIAMDWGLGLRLNLDIILLRLDTGIRLHDPGRAAGDRWIAPNNWFKGSNMAFHFGVGYPF